MEKRNELGKIIFRKCEKMAKGVALDINSNPRKDIFTKSRHEKKSYEQAIG
jgi:hypothetical protein